MTLIVVPAILAGLVIAIVALSVMFRKVVPTDMVHIVQSRTKTTSYGIGNKSNVYWAWPSFIPYLGVVVRELPVSNFDLTIDAYEAYDEDKVEFLVDVVAFFVIEDTNVAAQKVSSFGELQVQLGKIVKGAIRRVLGQGKVEQIMLERATFGDMFTKEVAAELKEWGVKSVKSMELMDIRDKDGNEVIKSIMDKKKSYIIMESRQEVAENNRNAEIAEIEAQRDVAVQKQEALQKVGERTAEKTQIVGMADEVAKQQILEQGKVTAEKDMEVKRVETVKLAQITKDAEIVTAEQDRDTTILLAEGQLEKQKREAEAIKVVGEANAEAEKLMQLAPVEAQIELSKEIGKNPQFQQYLLGLESVSAYKDVGNSQASALQTADVKVIANSGGAVEGMGGAMNLFSSSGGTKLAAAIEAFAQSPVGEGIINKVTSPTNGTATKSKAVKK